MVGCDLISNEDASQAIAEGRESQRLALEEAAPLEKEIQLLQDTAESLILDIDDIERQLEELFIQEENIHRNEIEPLYKQIAMLDSELNKVHQNMAYGSEGQSGDAQNREMSKMAELEIQLNTIYMDEIQPLYSQRDDINRLMDFDSDIRDQVSSMEDARETLMDELDDLYDQREDAYDSVRLSSDDSDAVRDLQNKQRDLDESSRDNQKEANETRRSYDEQIRDMQDTIDSLVAEKSSINDDQAKIDELNEKIDRRQTKLRDLETARSDKDIFYQDQEWALSDERDSINQQLESYFQKEEDNRDEAQKLVDAIDVDIEILEGQSEAIDDSVNGKYKKERDRIKQIEDQVDAIEQQIYDIEISKVKPIQEEMTQLLNDIKGMQNTNSSNGIKESGTLEDQDIPEEVKVLLLDQDNLRNQIKEIEETKIPALREQIDTLRVERSTKRDTLLESMKA
jgi:chromosome segregation ATPase